MWNGKSQLPGATIRRDECTRSSPLYDCLARRTINPGGTCYGDTVLSISRPFNLRDAKPRRNHRRRAEDRFLESSRASCCNRRASAVPATRLRAATFAREATLRGGERPSNRTPAVAAHRGLLIRTLRRFMYNAPLVSSIRELQLVRLKSVYFINTMLRRLRRAARFLDRSLRLGLKDILILCPRTLKRFVTHRWFLRYPQVSRFRLKCIIPLQLYACDN